MLTTIESVKRAARKGKKVTLAGLTDADTRKVLKMAGFLTRVWHNVCAGVRLGENSTKNIQKSNSRCLVKYPERIKKG